MTHPILPKLKTGHNVKNIPEVGKWDVRTRDSLEKLSTGLKVDKIETEISSIPDMWARPMLFEMALFNQQHVLHERVLGEWRGMLAMLALKEVVGLSRLTASQVTLPAPPPPADGDQSQETEVEQRDFLRTLSKLLPNSSLSGDTSWRTLHVFLFNGQPVGMTSPTTLVATAADYVNRVSGQEVGWYNGTHLKDPVGTLPPRQRQILSGWLDTLIDRVGQHPGLDRSRWDKLAGLLRQFANELGAGACTLSESGGFGIQGQGAGVFKYLNKPANGDITDASHVRLIPSEGRSPARSLLVFERGIADQWNMPPQDVTVEGAQTLAAARLPTSKTADVWREADFFTRKLFVIDQASAFPATLGAGHQSLTMPGGSNVVTPVLPLRPELMQHLTAEDLAERVRWDQTPEGFKLRLFLRLSGPDTGSDASRTVELSHLYRREDIHTLARVPTLEIWPNFRAAGWRAYYTCYSADNVTETFTAKPSAPGAVDGSEVSPGGRALRRYWRTETFPDTIICRAAVPNTQSNQMEEQDAGLLLLAPPPEAQPRGMAYRVGVDFGATSTTICARTGAQSFLVNFENRKVSVTASGDRAQAQLFDFFLPRRESEMPVLSFFDDFHNAPGQDLRPFLDGHAYLLETAELFDPINKDLDYDLKWSSKTDDRRKVRAFLTQLCLQAAAELTVKGATEVGWAFSYPTAFNEEQIEGFPGIWSQVTAECATQSGLRLAGDNERQTESVAAALYFVHHHHAATESGTIFIDIGGSTSDISVWQGKSPVWQTSLLLAGRGMFSNYLWHRPDFLGLFDVDVSLLSEVKRRFPTDRRRHYASTDTLLRYNSERIFKQLPIHAGTDQVKSLRQHLALGVSGLFYYVGSLLRHLTEAGVYRRAVPNVYVCGNGSRIFRWLDIDGEERINGLYKTIFSQAAGWAENQSFRVILSPEPKTEAAYGLVYESDVEGGNPERKVLAGESFIAEEVSAEWPAAEAGRSAGPRSLPWNTVLTPEALTLRLSPPGRLDRLTDLVETFNKFARNRGLIPPVNLSGGESEEVRRRLGQSLSRYRGVEETANVLVEPVFIMALRHWLEVRLGG